MLNEPSASKGKATGSYSIRLVLKASFIGLSKLKCALHFLPSAS